MSSIGRLFERESSSIYSLLQPSGGIRPSKRTRSRVALSLAEREEISCGVAGQQSMRCIARRLERPPSTISREIHRNGGYDGYRAAAADQATWDRGTEMANHRDITLATDIAVYFCDPKSPWQRGSNENTNRLLRQYFPKGIDLSRYTQAQLNNVARQLNERPRKTLDYATPAEKFQACVAATN